MFYKNSFYATCMNYGSMKTMQHCFHSKFILCCVFTFKTRAFNDFINNQNETEPQTTPWWSGLGLAPFGMKAK